MKFPTHVPTSCHTLKQKQLPCMTGSWLRLYCYAELAYNLCGNGIKENDSWTNLHKSWSHLFKNNGRLLHLLWSLYGVQSQMWKQPRSQTYEIFKILHGGYKYEGLRKTNRLVLLCSVMTCMNPYVAKFLTGVRMQPPERTTTSIRDVLGRMVASSVWRTHHNCPNLNVGQGMEVSMQTTYTQPVHTLGNFQSCSYKSPHIKLNRNCYLIYHLFELPWMNQSW